MSYPSEATAERHSVFDYRDAWTALLPTGSAWPREPDSVMQQTLLGLAGIWGEQDQSTNYSSSVNVDQQAGLLLEQESDPRRTVLMLPEWERAFGLPDLCLSEPLTIRDRQRALTARVAIKGGQSKAWFVNYAASIKYQVNVIEHAPFMAGVSRCGDTRNWDSEGAIWYRWEVGPPTIRWWWTVAPVQPRLTWFRCGVGGGHVGVDHILEIAQFTDLECAIRRYKPAHSVVTFDYAGLEPFNPYAGTGSPLEALYETSPVFGA